MTFTLQGLHPGVKRGQIQLAASSRPGSQTLPSCRHWRSQVPNSAGPQAPQASQRRGDREPRTAAQPTATAIRAQRRGLGEVRRCLKAWATAREWPWGGLWRPTVHSPALASGAPRSPAVPVGPPQPAPQGVSPTGSQLSVCKQQFCRSCHGAYPQATNGQKWQWEGIPTTVEVVGLRWRVR